MYSLYGRWSEHCCWRSRVGLWGCAWSDSLAVAIPTAFILLTHLSKGLERKTDTATRSHEFCIMHARCVYTLCGYVCSLFMASWIRGEWRSVCVSVWVSGTGNGLLHFNVPHVFIFFFPASFVCELVCECVRMVDLCRVCSVSKMNYDIDLLFIASY